jgi:hypothetical protein
MDASLRNAADSVLPNIGRVLIAWENGKLRLERRELQVLERRELQVLERRELQVMSTRAAEEGLVEYAEPFFASDDGTVNRRGISGDYYAAPY